LKAVHQASDAVLAYIKLARHQKTISKNELIEESGARGGQHQFHY